MRTQRNALFALTGLVLGGLVATTGCGSAVTDDSVGEEVTTVADTTAFRWRHHRGQTGTAGTSGTSGPTGPSGPSDPGVSTPPTDCDLCTKTQRCCQAAIGDNSLCNVSAATCSAMDGVRREAYVNSCLVTMNAIKGVRAAPPAECL